MANHLCPSCGFQHASDGNEVPAIEVNEVVAPSLDEIQDFLKKFVEQFGLSVDSKLSDVFLSMNGARAAAQDKVAPEPAKISASCPICIGQGAEFVTESAEEFTAHMEAGVHGKPAEELPTPPFTEPTDPPADPQPAEPTTETPAEPTPATQPEG